MAIKITITSATTTLLHGVKYMLSNMRSEKLPTQHVVHLALAVVSQCLVTMQ